MKQLIFLLLLCLCFTAFARSREIQRKIYVVHHINPHAPAIDGQTKDVVWKKAMFGDGFVQKDPVEGAPASEKTYFKIMYDEKNLYVLIRAYDSEPDKIACRLSRRDDIEDSDVVGVMLDSYNDKRTAFEFSLNAAGVKEDAVLTDDSDDGDRSWDPVWEAHAAVDDSGWIAEMRIPFNQLRFAKNGEYHWGLEVYRYIHRKKELTEWQPIPKAASGFVSGFGQMEGLKNISTSGRIEVLPYSVSKASTYEKEAGNPFSVGRESHFTGGLDGKIGLSGNMTMDFTINPDFGQVEADPSEVNLSAFETFFEEKRPFFIEGKNIFQFPLGLGDNSFAKETLFYSRRIGRQPQYEPDLSDDAWIRTPGQTSILGAVKLSGKTARGLSVGVLDAVTAEENADISLYGNKNRVVVEPLTNYFVGRLQKDLDEGNTSLGGMITSTNRNINHSYLNFLDRSAYTGGFDFMHQWKNKNYFMNFKMSFSHIRGDKEAILDAQTSSVRYYQRPDAHYVSVDSNRTSLSGYGGTFNIGKQGGGHWQYILGTVWRSPGFELNDLGYLREADNMMQFLWVGYRIYNPVSVFRNVSINLNQWNGWDYGGEKLFAGGNINGGAQFLNYWGFYLGIDRDGPSLSHADLRGGPSLRNEASWNNWYSVYSDSRKKWQFSLDGNNSWRDDRISGSHSLNLNLAVKPANNLTFSFGPFYQWGIDNLQYVDTPDKAGPARYIMAKMDQKTLGMVFRLNYSITPNLTIQYYGQPFVSAGRYSQFKRITHPRAAKYDQRFRNFDENQISYDAEDEIYRVDENRDGITDYSFDLPDFNFKQFQSNLVIRWEYNPGSQLYLVWSQGRTISDAFGRFSVKRDFRDMFSYAPDNIFLLKFNHWFSF